MIRYCSGSLFDSTMQTLVNTVNLKGVMGKGIALTFKERYPAMFAEYQARCESGELRIGTLYLYPTPEQWVLNFPTKRHYRNRSRLADIEQGLKALRDTYKELGITSLALPALGCGHGGLDWNDVRPLIERYLEGLDIDIEVYPPSAVVPESPPSKDTMISTEDASEQMSLPGLEPDANAANTAKGKAAARTKRRRKS